MTQYLLEGRALELGVEIDSLYDSLRRKRESLESEAEREWAKFRSRVDQELDGKMRELMQLLGLSHEDGGIQVDGSYYEELGIMLLTQAPEPPESETFEIEEILRRTET